LLIYQSHPQITQTLCNLRMGLTVLSCFCEIVVDHAATIFAGLGYSGVSAFFVTTDLVLSVKSFEHELTRGNEVRVLRLMEIKRNRRGLPKFRLISIRRRSRTSLPRV